MSYSLVFTILGSIALVQSQPSIQLQFLGKAISREDQQRLNLCESKYCVLDANYLFSATTQNKSINPCEDFEEFALGTYIKYRAISERKLQIGFEEEVEDAFKLRMKKVLSEKINDKDIAVTKYMKKFYSKCVNSGYVRRSGVKEMREYLAALGLKFYPETDQNNFDLKTYFEKNPTHALENLLECKVVRFEEGSLALAGLYSGPQEPAYFSSFEDLLYEIFNVYLSSTATAKKFRKKFHEIVVEITKFFEERRKSSDWTSDYDVVMSISELNEMTSQLNLDWLTIINNQLLTKVTTDQKITVGSTMKLRNVTNFIASADKSSIANFLAYNFIRTNSKLVEVYQSSKYDLLSEGTLRSAERWDQCLQSLTTSMGPALTFLYSLRYRDEEQEKYIKEFISEAKNFAVRKIRKETKWNETVIEGITSRIQSLKVIAGFSANVLNPQTLEEIYSDLDLSDEQSLVHMSLAIQNFFEKKEREPEGSKIQTLYDEPFFEKQSPFTRFYIRHDDYTLFIQPSYLHYPFFYHQRPRFFNSATVAQRLFREFYSDISVHYLGTIYGDFFAFEIFKDEFQIAYEFYDEWLKSGGKDLQIGAHRLTDQQLYWIAAARVFYSKIRHDSHARFTNFHEQYMARSGFREAFHCKANESQVTNFMSHLNQDDEWQ